VKELILKEHESLHLRSDELDSEMGHRLWSSFGAYIDVEFPNPRNDHHWVIKNNGFVGILPVSEDLTVYLESKTELAVVFSMLEWAWDLKQFKVFDEVRGCEEVQEIYERLTSILASRVSARVRQGLYREYMAQQEYLGAVRGTPLVSDHIKRPWRLIPECIHDEHTADMEDNQIPLWALNRILHSGICGDRTMGKVRKAYRSLSSMVSLEQVRAEQCRGRAYSRLNEDYRALHALSRFFIEQAGPTHRVGDKDMLPFVLNIATLYEKFVAKWLDANLPNNFSINDQERLILSKPHDIKAQVDLVLYDRSTQEAVAVLDTKYKTGGTPSNDDIYQVNTYANAMGTALALLVYPDDTHKNIDVRIGDVWIKSLTFSTKEAPETSGKSFVEKLMSALDQGSSS